MVNSQSISARDLSPGRRMKDRSGMEIDMEKAIMKTYLTDNPFSDNREGDGGVLPPQDYIEPRCVLCGDPYGKLPEEKPVPQQRIIEKMDEYMSRRDYAGAERHLQYWLEEARLGQDERGELMIRNELIGHYRKTGEKEKSLRNGEAALKLVEKLDFDGTVSAGTTYVNYATACNAFGENERALGLFEKALAVFEARGGVKPDLLGGLYNNMALACVSTGQFERASALYEKALAVMADVPGGELEQAITYLNMADAVEAAQGPEEGEAGICGLLDKAFALFNSTGAPRDGYYAFVCEKCASAFSYHGYFLEAEELSERAREIYKAISDTR